MKKILMVIDPYDPILSIQQIKSMFHYHYKEKDQVYVQMMEYHRGLYEYLKDYASVLPPLNLRKSNKKDESNNQHYWQFSFVPLTIPRNIRIASYNYPSITAVFWNHLSPLIQLDRRVYDHVLVFSQGVSVFYVKEKIETAKVTYYLHVISPLIDLREELPNWRYITNSFSFYHWQKTSGVNVLYQRDNHQLEMVLAAAKIGEGFSDRGGMRILSPGNWSTPQQLDEFIHICREIKKKKLSVRWYLYGNTPFIYQIIEEIHKYQLQNQIVLLGEKHNLYQYLKQADFYMEWEEGQHSLLSEAILLDKPVLSLGLVYPCVRYLEGKVLSYELLQVVTMFRQHIQK